MNDIDRMSQRIQSLASVLEGLNKRMSVVVNQVSAQEKKHNDLLRSLKEKFDEIDVALAAEKPRTRARKPVTMEGTVPLHNAVSHVVKTKFESQAEAARTLGITPAHLSRLMSGQRQNPSDDTLTRLGIRRHIGYTVE